MTKMHFTTIEDDNTTALDMQSRFGNLGYTLSDPVSSGAESINQRLAGKRLAATFDSIGDGIITIDGEGRILLANAAAKAYLAELTDVSSGDILTHLNQVPLEKFLEPPPSGKKGHEVILTEPSRRVFEVVARPIEVDSGKDKDSQSDTEKESDGEEVQEVQDQGWVLVIRDVSEAWVARERIQQQESMAVAGRLAAGTAHYFNNILTSIIGLAELAAVEPTLPPSTRVDLERIVHQGERAADLIRQILDFSGKSIARKKKLNLTSLLKETIDQLRPNISKNIQISPEIEPGHENYMINADPNQLKQALTNIVLNALDAMPAGGTLQLRLSAGPSRSGEGSPVPEVSVSGEQPGSTDWLTLTISDTGVGISPEHLSRVFEPFFTTKEVGQGTGLGLAQVYGIIKQHQGAIEVESQAGQGTVFTLYLPRQASSDQRSSKVVKEAELPYGDGEIILLVEDKPEVLEVIRAMLERLGYKVLTATNGREALAVYDKQPADISLVLTDLTMPEMDGMMLARILQERNAAVKIMALTGYPLEVESRKLLAQGVVDWLLKPLSLRQLAQSVSRVLHSE